MINKVELNQIEYQLVYIINENGYSIRFSSASLLPIRTGIKKTPTQHLRNTNTLIHNE